MKNKLMNYLLEEEECSEITYKVMYILAIVVPIVSIIISELVKRG